MENTFGGSGYDIACAKAKGPILYYTDEESINSDPADFDPSFSENLYFIYLGKKQNSRDQIELYSNKKVRKSQIDEISQITRSFCEASSLKCFNELIEDHESLISEILGIAPLKQETFGDYWGSIKSLGAWGGDFILATSDQSREETKSYFNQKGFEVFFGYEELKLSESEVIHSNS
ncbi:MAG: hypothetical protein IPL46_07855 [Saprospiraceae bacterium]|nr:hypothetical protein [Saprospiraceae bacterium]